MIVFNNLKLLFFLIVGDMYINGEIIPCQYPTYQPKQARSNKYKSKAYVRQRDGPPSDQRRTRQGTTPESAS